MPNSQEVDDQKQLDEPNECLGRNARRRTARSVPGISHDEMIPISGTIPGHCCITDDAPVPDRPEPGGGGIRPAIRLGQAGDPSSKTTTPPASWILSIRNANSSKLANVRAEHPV
jgi:hypothetical protein